MECCFAIWSRIHRVNYEKNTLKFSFESELSIHVSVIIIRRLEFLKLLLIYDCVKLNAHFNPILISFLCTRRENALQSTSFQVERDLNIPHRISRAQLHNLRVKLDIYRGEECARAIWYITRERGLE